MLGAERPVSLLVADGAVHTNSLLAKLTPDISPRRKANPRKLGGQWNVVDREVNNGDGGFISGIFYGGKMGKTSFNLLAIHNHLEGLCDNDSVPTKGTITGQCGLGAKIDVRFENGAHGTFTGSVNCI